MRRNKAKKLKGKSLDILPLVLNGNGYDCQHYALAAVLLWLYQSKLIDQKPAPARRREDPEYKGPSLRWHLKHHHQSATGEVHNVEDLAATAETQAQVAAHFCECKSQQEYNETLIKSIDQGLPAIIFFDVEARSGRLDFGMPTQVQGAFEHAAVVVRYDYDPHKKLIFRIAQWGKYYDCVATKLFESSSQLPSARIFSDNYLKIRTGKKNEGAWLPEDYVLRNNYTHRVIQKRLETSPAKNGGFRGKILILDSTIKPRLNLSAMPVKFSRLQTSNDAKSQPKGFTVKLTRAFKTEAFWKRQMDENRQRIGVAEKIKLLDKPSSMTKLNLDENRRLLLFPFAKYESEPQPTIDFLDLSRLDFKK